MGWDKSFPAAVAKQLISRWPDMDFTGVQVVVSGGRAGRRILSLLVDIAADKGLPMVPPDFITIGELPERLYRRQLPAANSFIRQVAWVAALQQANPDNRAALFPRLNPSIGPSAWTGAATLLDRCNDDLAAGMSRFADVLEKANTNSGLGDSDRWQAAARLHAGYLRVLGSMGFSDTQQAREQAVELDQISTRGPIVLAGVVELSAQARTMLQRVTDVQALVYAPAEHADGFEEFGCVKTAYWFDREVDLSEARLRSAAAVWDQAETLFSELAERIPAVRAVDVTIGAVDEALIAHVETTAANLPNIAVRYGAGTLLSRTRPFQLLKVVADYLQSSEFRHFAILVRHPDVEIWLRADAENPQAAAIDWRPVLDRYAADFLPVELGPQHCEAEGWRKDASSRAGDDRMDLAWLYSKIETLLGRLRQPQGTDVATADQWAEPILKLLQRIYGRVWDQTDARQRLVVMACQALRDQLNELHAAAGIIDRSAFPLITADEAIGSLLGLCGSRRLPPPVLGNEIEIVGWLELMPDDARHLIIAGFNEGCVPESSRVGPLIHETVREQLGLPTDRDRLARDKYLLTAIVQSRPPGSVTIISGRKSAKDDPLLPSRLLFACDVKTMAERVQSMAKDPQERRPLALRFSHARRSGFKIGATIPPSVRPITQMRVIAFRDYLGSPQGFYLKHILGLETLQEIAPRELDPGQYGTLIHQVLRDFEQSPAAQSSSVQQCQDTLLGTLENIVTLKFGGGLSGAMKFQIEMIRKRLELVAEKQAAWYAQGWRIAHTEWESSDAGIRVDDAVMGLRGRIDRIDRHEQHGYAILDYKICTGEKKPERSHKSCGKWIDLQLPLYRHLAQPIIGPEEVRLGYFAISDTEKHTGINLAGWDQETLADADATAQQVIRDVREGRFQERGDRPPTEGIFGHIFGDGVLAIDIEDEQEGVAS